MVHRKVFIRNKLENGVAVMKFGYIRLWGREEEDAALKAQMLALLEDERTLFVDIRDKAYTRPAYERMCKTIQPGDVIYIDELDCLGRDYEDMAAEWRRLVYGWNVDVVVVNQKQLHLDSRVFRELGPSGEQMQQLMLNLLEYMAALRYRKVRDRQRKGIEQARKEGRPFGRPRKVRDEALMRQTAQRWLARAITMQEASRILGVSRSTLYQDWKKMGYIKEK